MAQDEKYLFALPQGTILAGQYVIEQTLGQGGFGITYRATDHKTGQRVAVKEFFPDSMAARTTATTVSPFPGARGESFVYGKECFLQEAETLAKFIGNEHIVRVYSYFEENGTAYFVMEYVEGTSFDRYIKDQGGKVSYEEAEKILLPIIDALAVVHAKGIVHRDVTPDNIYITKDGNVKLLDFGAARYSLGDKSRSLDVVLKHGFAPKEQYTRHGRQGAFTDVYTVGASFYFAITGRRPPDSIDRMDEDELIPPSSLVKIPPEKEDAILKAMSVQPANRYQTMVDFREALMIEPEEEMQDVEAQAAAAVPLQGAAAAQSVPPQSVEQRVFTAAQAQPEAEAKPVQQISQSASQPVPAPQPAPQPVYIQQQPNVQQEPASALQNAGVQPIQQLPRKKFTAKKIAVLAGAALALVVICVGVINQPKKFVYEYRSDGTAVLTGVREDVTGVREDVTGAVSIPATVKHGFRTYRVTSIGSYAFAFCSSLTSIEIPDSVTEIGGGAFSGCSSLTSIEIPDSVTEIGWYAFCGCSNLTSITIPAGVTFIGVEAFKDCSSLTSIEIPDSVTSIGGYAFADCSSLTSIRIPDGVTGIGNEVFKGCSRLTSIEIPASVTEIGDKAFYNCSRLTSIEIPDSVTEIGDKAFYNCSSLTSIEIPDSVTSIGGYAFYNCSRLTSIELPDSVTGIGIGDYAFCGCSSLTSIELPDGVTKIGSKAFEGCSSLTSIKIPDGVTKIGTNAFFRCSSLTSITIPDSVTEIGRYAFGGCSSLTTVIYGGRQMSLNEFLRLF